MASLILAVRFLTIVPVPGREAVGPGALGRAAWWFPAVGLGLGAGLVLADRLLARAFPPLLAALLVVSVWKVATGGIHLDGLADCLDGLGGHGADQRLAIMRDSRIGVFGALGLILTFLIGVTALAELPGEARWRALLLAPVAGRLSPLVAAACFRAATPGAGAGGAFMVSLSPWAAAAGLVATGLLAAWLFGLPGALAVAAALVGVLLWSGFLSSRLGGLTGDVLGAGVELAELGTLLALAAASGVRS
ncbi:MAG: adenosylcobinamide-GDP ribazoletransferase [Candidatus Rokubacteria bacterium]|nr:adenosylcobinamide-GDP ribazoletransferase [Candidatus Rokubacteria bacterium]